MGDNFVVCFRSILIVLLYCVSSFNCDFSYKFSSTWNTLFPLPFYHGYIIFHQWSFRTKTKIRHLKKRENHSVQQYKNPYVNRQPLMTSTDLKESRQAIMTSMGLRESGQIIMTLLGLRESGQAIMTSTSWRELGHWRT